MSERVDVEPGIVYGSGGKLLDVYRPARTPEPVPTVLLWHGRGPDERDVLAAVAREAAAHGVTVMVPDWRSDAPDGGWAHLTESIAYLRAHAPAHGGDAHRTVLAGWSLGALAAASLLLHSERVGGWLPTAFVGVAGGYTWDKPGMGVSAPVADVAGGTSFPVPVELVHGTGDTIVDARESRTFRDVLVEHGHRVSLTETDSDHAGVVGAEYSPEHERCVPARSEPVRRAGRTCAAVLVRAAGV